MNTENFDTFISYRRSTGSVIASRIYDNLLLKGFSPFYDITEMHAGRFDEQLKNRIINANNFVLILTENSLDRCIDPEDWVAAEISLAISYHLNIVIVQEKSFTYPDNLPQNLKDLHLYQSVIYTESDFHVNMENLAKMLLKKQDIFSVSPISHSETKRINLTGEYITLYEDIFDGKKVVIKAPAKLKQRGVRITGVTNFGDYQTWNLRATLYKKKRLAGIYYARDVLDDGLGTFFLEIKSANVLEGFWSGYDNVNRMLTSGRYLFKKKYTNFTIQPLRNSDILEVCEIADEQLGKNYITEELLFKIKNDLDNVHCVCVTDKTTKSVIAFSIYSFISKEEALNVSSQKVTELKYAEKIGYLKTIAVKSSHMNFGIGSELVDFCIAKMCEQGVDIILSTAWKHAGIINIGGILEKSGFNKRMEIADYWTESSIKDGYQCPQCGNPCRCTCVIYTLNKKKDN